MAISVRPQQVRRYGDIARLLAKYGRGEAASHVRDQWNGEKPSGAISTETGDQMVADAQALAADFERLGPTFVKLGQLLSTRTDLLPPPYIDALSRLQERCDPLPFEVVEAVVREEFGVPIGDRFAGFDPDPLASASLGQVHHARLHDGREVAVKVQRPDVAGGIVEDLEAIAEMAALGRPAHRNREIVRVRPDGRGVPPEHAGRARLPAAKPPTCGCWPATWPTSTGSSSRSPIDDHCTGRVLTMEFIDGRPLSAAAGQAVDGPALAEALAGAYLHQIVEDGFVHADPHPGNLRLTSDGRLALLDVGMTTRLRPSDPRCPVPAAGGHERERRGGGGRGRRRSRRTARRRRLRRDGLRPAGDRPRLRPARGDRRPAVTGRRPQRGLPASPPRRDSGPGQS